MGKGGPTKNGMIFKIPLCGYLFVNNFSDFWAVELEDSVGNKFGLLKLFTIFTRHSQSL